MKPRALHLVLYVTDAERESMRLAAEAAGFKGISAWAELNLPQLAEVEGQEASNQESSGE